jgi:hydroxymethylpyrimidine pyrophosphatase-like HAD family hydrolase
MRVNAAAFDYDETLARDGAVTPGTIDALQRLRASDRKLILVTGRELEDLLRLFPYPEIFERIVSENGGVLCRPDTGQIRLLNEPPPAKLIGRLRDRGVQPLSLGRIILATHEPQEKVVLEVIHELGIEYHIIFNKGAVMILPSSVNKATGLKAALKELQIAPATVAGIGDAENDHAFLSLCGLSAAVANALPALKEHVQFVTQAENGEGVLEWIEKILSEG